MDSRQEVPMKSVDCSDVGVPDLQEAYAWTHKFRPR
jgi:hypothetical protein